MNIMVKSVLVREKIAFKKSAVDFPSGLKYDTYMMSLNYYHLKNGHLIDFLQGHMPNVVCVLTFHEKYSAISK